MAEIEKRRTISIPEWHEMAMQDAAPPMRIPIHGNSMFPVIRMDRDFVTVQPLKGMPDVGDIVLFHDPKGEKYVLHRVWKTGDGRVLTWGDNCSAPDGWQPLEKVWGKAVLIERGRRKIRTDPKKGLILAKIWHPAGKVYRRGRALAAGAWRRVKRPGK